MQPSRSAPSLAPPESSSALRLRNGLPMRLSAWLSVASSSSPLARRVASYVRLEGEVLSIHADQFALPTDELDLRRAAVEYATNKPARRDFRLVVAGRAFVFKCDSFEQMQTWATSIEHAAQRSFDAFYTLGALIAEGSHAKVYTAYPRHHHHGDQQHQQVQQGKHPTATTTTTTTYAVKVIKRRSHDVHEAAQLARELRIAALLPAHPNVVHPVDVFAAVDRVHIVMELMSGGTLADLLQRHPRLPEPHVRAVMRNIFAALVHLHANHIVHRDIRPENVFCSQRRFPMELALGDFGDANLVSDPSGQERVNRDILSTMTGDPLYMATEIVRRQKYGPAADLWSAGVLMFRLLSGELPFTGLSTRAVYDAVCAARFSTDTSPWHSVSPAAKSLVRQLLQPDPHKRISAIAALHHHWLLPTVPSAAPSPLSAVPLPPLAFSQVPSGITLSSSSGDQSRIPRSAPPPNSSPFPLRQPPSPGPSGPSSISAVTPAALAHIHRSSRAFRAYPSSPALQRPASHASRPPSGASSRRNFTVSSSSASSTSSSEEVTAVPSTASRGVSDMIRDFENGCILSAACESPLTTDDSSSSLCGDDDVPGRTMSTSRIRSSASGRSGSVGDTQQKHDHRASALSRPGHHESFSQQPSSLTAGNSTYLTIEPAYRAGVGGHLAGGDMEQPPRMVVTPSLRKIHQVGLHEAARENPARMHRILSNKVMKQQLSTLLPGRRKLIVTARAFIAVFRILALVRGHSLTRQLSVIEEDEQVDRAHRVNEIVDKRKAFHLAKGAGEKTVEAKCTNARQSRAPRAREEASPDGRQPAPARHLSKLLQRTR